MFNYKNRSIQIFADGLSVEKLKTLDFNLIDGLTYNPTLFKNLEVEDYYDYAKEIVKKAPNLSISLEIIADNHNDTIIQAKKLAQIGNNVSIKIPITFTNGDYTFETIQALVSENIKLNITAIFTKKQIKVIIPLLKNTVSILSVFAGRLYDIGLDAKSILSDITEYVHNNGQCKVLWASPRMSYDIINAIESNCDIITMQDNLIAKLNLFNKSPENYSLETVKMFYNDALTSNYEI